MGNQGESKLYSITDDREYAWNYFQVHAAQRLTTFNFYLLLSTLMATGLLTTVNNNSKYHFICSILGLLLCVFSFVFKKLDLRNKELIRNAENALKEIENNIERNHIGNDPHYIKLFLRDDCKNDNEKKLKSFFPWKNNYSYSDCFQIVFFCFFCIGLLGIIAGIISFLRDLFSLL